MKHTPRKFNVRLGSPPNSEINITPLVDVVLVLLIIFMVVTPLLEKDIEVKVPQQEKVEQLDEVPPNQLVVSIDKEGVLSISVSGYAEKVDPADYVDKLKKAIATKSKGDRVVFFTADDKANYGKLVTALDGAKLAGAEVLGMATDKIEAPKAPDAPAPDAPAPTP